MGDFQRLSGRRVEFVACMCKEHHGAGRAVAAGDCEVLDGKCCWRSSSARIRRRCRQVGLDAIETANPPALVRNERLEDAELVEPKPDCTDLPHDSMAERAGNGGRRTYTLSDFERCRPGREAHRHDRPLGDQLRSADDAMAGAGRLN